MGGEDNKNAFQGYDGNHISSNLKDFHPDFDLVEDIDKIIPEFPSNIQPEQIQLESSLDIPVMLWNTDFGKLDKEQYNLLTSSKCYLC